jgi:hypothetical protein
MGLIWIPAFAGMSGDWFNGGANQNSSHSSPAILSGLADQKDGCRRGRLYGLRKLGCEPRHSERTNPLYT